MSMNYISFFELISSLYIYAQKVDVRNAVETDIVNKAEILFSNIKNDFINNIFRSNSIKVINHYGHYIYSRLQSLLPLI